MTSAQGEPSGSQETRLKGPESWITHEKFNVNFNRVAAGWEELSSDRVAQVASKIFDSKLAPMDERSRERVFVTGNLGYIPDNAVSRTLGSLEKGLELAGDLQVKKAAPAPAGSYAVAQQFFRERPIYGAGLALHRNENHVAYAVTGNLAPVGIEPKSEPKKIKAGEAAMVVAQELETDASKLKVNCEETWLPVEDELYPCFHVRATCFDPFGDWYGFVSFEAELLALFNVASAVSATMQGYKINPTRTPNLEALALNALGAPNVLTGSRTTIWGPNQSQAQGEKGTFNFAPTSEEFDEPQLYYFLEFCRDQGAALGNKFLTSLFAGVGFNPMNGTVHYDGALDNAYYSPNTGQLYFGDTSDGAAYSSRSLDIVLHEFGHAISDTICHLGRARANDQSRAMSEGYSDYFAATILGNPVIGDDFMPSYARSCGNTLKFPRGFAGEEHAVGTVWAGLLWDLRNDPTIGQHGADLTVLQSLTYLGPWKTILQGLEALVQADRVLSPGPDGKRGAHEDTIRAAFKARAR